MRSAMSRRSNGKGACWSAARSAGSTSRRARRWPWTASPPGRAWRSTSPSVSGPKNVSEMFQFATDQAADAVFWMDGEARFLYVNDEACETLGYTRDELLQLGLFDIDPEYPARSGPSAGRSSTPVAKSGTASSRCTGERTGRCSPWRSGRATSRWARTKSTWRLPATSPTAGPRSNSASTSSGGCCTPRNSRASACWPAGSPTTSTTC